MTVAVCISFFVWKKLFIGYYNHVVMSISGYFRN